MPSSRDVLVLFIQEKGGGVAHQEPPVVGVPETVDVQTVAQDGDAAESAFLRLVGDAVRRSGPKPAFLAVENHVYLVVGQAEGVVGAEVLVVFVNAVFVQAPGRGDPDVAVAVLGEGVHPLVGQAVGYDAAFCGEGERGVLPAVAGRQDEECSEEESQSDSHRFVSCIGDKDNAFLNKYEQK